MKDKKKYLAKWVEINELGSDYHKKVGVVMDEEYLRNGILCCRVLLGKDVVAVEARNLKLVQM